MKIYYYNVTFIFYFFDFSKIDNGLFGIVNNKTDVGVYGFNHGAQSFGLNIDGTLRDPDSKIDNKSYENKWFYCFVDDFNYINDFKSRLM